MEYERLYSPSTLLGALNVDGCLPGLPFYLPAGESRASLLGFGCNGLVVEMCAKEEEETYAVKFVNSPSMDSELEAHELASAAGIAPPLYDGERRVFKVAEDWCAMPMMKVNARPLAPGDEERLRDLVSELHSLGISHGDVKPSNFLAEESRIYLSDFGCSYVHDGRPVTLFSGDPLYMPLPSQMKEKETKRLAFEIDLYSLGKTLEEIKRLP